jgi:hypothetical protein
MTPAEIRTKAALFDTRSHTQDRLGAIAIGVVILANVVSAIFESNPVERIGDGLTVLAAVCIVVFYTRARRQARDDARLGGLDSLAFSRSVLTRRRDEVRQFWLRYALPFVPGIVLSINGRSGSPRSVSQYVALAVGLLVLVAGIAWMNRREAAKLQTEIDALDESS